MSRRWRAWWSSRRDPDRPRARLRGRTFRSRNGCSAGRRRWCWSSRSWRWPCSGRSRGCRRSAGGPLPRRPRSPDREPPRADRLRGDRGVPARRGRVQRPPRHRRAPPPTSRRRSSTWSSGSGSCRPASCSATCSARSTRGAPSAGPWRGWRALLPAPTCRRRWPTPSGWATGPPPPASSRSPRWSWWPPTATSRRTVAIATLVYSAVTFVGMALYGVEPWIRPRRGLLASTTTCSRGSRRSRRATARSACAASCPAWPL